MLLGSNVVFAHSWSKWNIMGYAADKLRKSLERTDVPTIVDVRSRREFRKAHIPGAIHLPFWLMSFRYKLLDNYRDKDLIVYCEHGPRAVFARQVLQSKGFAKVDCLVGHMQAWRKSGFPIQYE